MWHGIGDHDRVVMVQLTVMYDSRVQTYVSKQGNLIRQLWSKLRFWWKVVATCCLHYAISWHETTSKWLMCSRVISVSLDAAPSKCVPPTQSAFDLTVILTFDLWPWKSFEQCPLVWWIFVASFMVIPPLTTEDPSSKYGGFVSREIGVNEQWTTRKHSVSRCLLLAADATIIFFMPKGVKCQRAKNRS